MPCPISNYILNVIISFCLKSNTDISLTKCIIRHTKELNLISSRIKLHHPIDQWQFKISINVKTISLTKAEVKNQLIKKIKGVRSDRGGEWYGRNDASGEKCPGNFA